MTIVPLLNVALANAVSAQETQDNPADSNALPVLVRPGSPHFFERRSADKTKARSFIIFGSAKSPIRRTSSASCFTFSPFKTEAFCVKGMKAPLFSLPSSRGEMVNLLDYLSKKIIVIYFYHRSYSPFCTMQTTMLSKQNYLFERLGAKIFGICIGSIEEHTERSTAYWVPFTILNDLEGSVGDRYERSKDKDAPPGRTTCVIDLDGVVRMKYCSVTNVKAHVSKALKKVEKLTLKV